VERQASKIGREWREGVYLTTVYTNMEAEIVESKLRSEGVPSIKRYNGASSFIEIFAGTNTTQDIDIYVPTQELETALDIIVPTPIGEDFELE
jgi:hypothetical protein